MENVFSWEYRICSLIEKALGAPARFFARETKLSENVSTLTLRIETLFLVQKDKIVQLMNNITAKLYDTVGFSKT